MNLYLFDKENDDLVRDDGEKLCFKTVGAIYDFLKSNEYKDGFIKSNFYYVKAFKITIPMVAC